ncbi:unnamed protein product [Vitrella brassicaformis CCMP3155]|uniref:Uncharacterized protein n=1 Tax=Vitrella brassicaformis (strain CCMP3155) TaxID=1169540 RepID=A0A0G4GKJ2_VITBC|nr:unnamed protein product [Vitrella brassicaformis CCMP3155]|eukprot:CEM30512.1 unnamed protein product [Vitrella brassicaformis CCMP3155]
MADSLTAVSRCWVIWSFPCGPRPSNGLFGIPSRIGDTRFGGSRRTESFLSPQHLCFEGRALLPSLSLADSLTVVSR